MPGCLLGVFLAFVPKKLCFTTEKKVCVECRKGTVCDWKESLGNGASESGHTLI